MNQKASGGKFTLGGSTRYVNKYLTGIFLIICLVVLSVFWGFNYKSTALVKDHLLHEGQAFFRQIDLTREWIDNHDGVYVKLAPGVKVNPFLAADPNLKAVISDRENEKYTLKHSPIVIREISKLASSRGIIKFKITSLDPINPDNAPDAFERTALENFARGKKEYFLLQESEKEALFYYMAPFVYERSCMQCHSASKEGLVLGGVSITLGATHIVGQIRDGWIYLIVSAAGIVGLFFGIIYLISRSFIKDLENAERKLVEMASKDPLTGLLNRREGFRRIGEEISRAVRLARPLSLLLIDIDHFKKINDTYGHATGDDVLKALSRLIMEEGRVYDIPVRYGGEEFLVATPETPRDNAKTFAERLRRATEALVVTSKDGSDLRITISTGVAQLKENETLELALSRADAALYEAKNSGRNRVCMSEG
ncbi:MAG: Diguanylate cyclase [Actinobacteria bacterium]|nr:Diguanylate cyclase [Actinomycetota bacterium]